MKKYFVGEAEQIPEGRGVAVQVGRQVFAVFRSNGQFYAIFNRCPHKGGSLCDGIVEKESKVVRCPWHFWNWSLETGCLEAYPAKQIPVLPVKVEDGQVWLLYPESESVAEST